MKALNFSWKLPNLSFAPSPQLQQFPIFVRKSPATSVFLFNNIYNHLWLFIHYPRPGKDNVGWRERESCSGNNGKLSSLLIWIWFCLDRCLHAAHPCEPFFVLRARVCEWCNGRWFRSERFFERGKKGFIAHQHQRWKSLRLSYTT